jgi:hypothetical protein
MTLNGGMGMVRCGEQADELLQQTQAEAGVGAALRALPDRAAFAVALLNRVHAQCSPFLHPTEPPPAEEGESAERRRTAEAASTREGSERERRTIHAEFPPLVRSLPYTPVPSPQPGMEYQTGALTPQLYCENRLCLMP